MNLLHHSRGRTILFAALYLSEGAPIGFIWWALPTLLRAEGIPLERITSLTALLVLPWMLKFLWAPLVDAWRGPRWGFRAWIISAQLLMGSTLIPLIWLPPAEHLEWWTRLLLLHAVAAATQDVAIDALAIHTVPETQRGWLNGCMQAGMLIGRSLFGGGVLLLAAQWGWPGMLLALVTCVWSTLFLIGWAREPQTLAGTRAGFREFFGKARKVLRRRATWLGLGFALVAGAGFEAAGALAGPYLIDWGMAKESVGWFYGLPVVLATLSGGIIGGRLADGWGVKRIATVGMLGWVAMILALALVDGPIRHPADAWLPCGCLTGMYFFVGVFTASSYSLFMNLTEPALGGTQFSAYMAATNGCESWSVWAGGRLAGAVGYPAAWVNLSVVSLLGLFLLIPLPRFPCRPLGERDLKENPPSAGRTPARRWERAS